MKRVIFVKANERYAPPFCSRTLFLQDEAGRREVVKKPSSPQSVDHVLQMAQAGQKLKELLNKIEICPCEKVEEGVRFDYIDHREDWLHRLLAAAESPVALAACWREFFGLLQPSRPVPFSETEGFVQFFGSGAAFAGEMAYPCCAVDMTPANLLIDPAGRNVLIDYEWFCDFPVPVQVLQYHALRVSVDAHPEMLRKMTEEELLTQLGLAEKKDALTKAEKAFFHYIYGENLAGSGTPFDLAYKKGETSIYELNSVESLKAQNLQLQAQVSQEQQENDRLAGKNQQLSESLDRMTRVSQKKQEQLERAEAEKQFLSQELKRTQDQLLLAWNSKSWRMTAPLRFLRRMKEEKKNPLTELAQRFRETPVGEEPEAAASAKNHWMPAYKVPYQHSQNTVKREGARRIAIMYFFDKEGVVDGTAVTLAQGIRPAVERMVAVVGGAINEAGKETLERLYDQVWYKENEGFDFHGYREGLLREGWDRLAQYDEVLLCNFTILGPVYPLPQLFDQMAEVDCDFWGITSHPGIAHDPFGCNPYGRIPEHLQSYFLVFRKNMVQQDIFQKFWKKLPKLNTYDQAVGLAETVLTPYFEEAGFHWATSTDHEAYYPLTDNPVITMPLELMRDYGSPFFKNRVFFQDYDYYVYYTCGQTSAQLMAYLQENQLYDMDLLWRHLLRTCHMSDLCEKLHLSKTLPEDPLPQSKQPLTTAAVIHIYDVSMLPEIIADCRSLPPETDIYISTTNQEKKQAIEQAFSCLKNKAEVVVGENRGRDISGMLVLFREKIKRYDLVCVTHDKQTSHLKPLTVGRGFAYAGYTNILASPGYVRRIIDCFASEPRLGMMMAPMPYHADFCTQLGNEWGSNYETTRRLAESLGLRCPLDEQHPPCAPFGSNFWFRVAAMKPLLDREWSYGDFPAEPLGALDGTIMHAVERIYPYCAQSEGYYVSLVMTEAYAGLEMSTLYTYAEGWAGMMAEQGLVGRFADVRDALRHRLSDV